MNATKLKDKSISVIIWNTEKEDDVRVYLGRFKIENEKYYFINEEKGWRITLHEEQIKRIKRVSADEKEMLLNADYAFSLNMSLLPEAGNENYRGTGINWNDE